MDKQLYTIEWGPPRAFYFEPYGLEPLDVYEYKISTLPEEVAEEAERIRLANGGLWLDDLLERGVTRVDWRQYPTEILGSGAVTTPVFDALNQLTEGRISSNSQIGISFAGFDGYTTYQLLSHSEAERDPLYHCADLSRTPELADSRDMAESRRRTTTLWREGTSITVWLPRSLLERPQAMYIGALHGSQLFVNQEFVDAWRETDVSRRLREHPWEIDLHFVPYTLREHRYEFFDDQ